MEQEINKILGVSESFFAPQKILEIIFDREKREHIFNELRKLVKGDLSYDMFHEYFQEEHADRVNKKQDFTPTSVIKLMNKILDDGNLYYECACGTGGIVVGIWNNNRLKYIPWEYNPSRYFFELEELSDRTIPFLLINLMIRGINATVVHGDTLTRKSKGVFLIQNFDNEPLGYSDINVFPYTKLTEKTFNIEFVEKSYPEHVERNVLDYIKNLSITDIRMCKR